MDPQIAKVLKGDLAAYKPLVEKHQKAVWRTMSVLLYDPAKTRKLVEGVFVDALFSLAKADHRAGFDAHVQAVARKRVRAELAHALEHTDQLKVFREQMLKRFEDDPAAAAWLKRSAAAFDQCAAKLPDNAKAMVKARWVDGRDLKSIGKAIGRPETAVRQTIVRVRLALYPCIRQALGG